MVFLELRGFPGCRTSRVETVECLENWGKFVTSRPNQIEGLTEEKQQVSKQDQLSTV